MNQAIEDVVKSACAACDNDRTRMMDIVCDVQKKLQHVPSEAMDLIAGECGTHRVEVESVVSFYAFLNEAPKGEVVIRICNDVVDLMHGADNTAKVFEQELGIKMGETTPDGKITLEWAPCIGMSDQTPAALINDEVVTYLSTDKARRICEKLKQNPDAKSLTRTYGDGNNGHELVKSMVINNIRKSGPVIFADYTDGEAIHKATRMTPQEVIRDVKTARLRGRGGAGFPAGMKWDFTRAAGGETRTLICNADEGEPGTFKDRVILTEQPGLLFEGMTIAAYAIGAEQGILYLRGEYAYLREFLEAKLQERREAKLLGENINGKDGFSFDIRIQMGAGAYICGEETALISSCEGLRGDPKNRPPFPAQKGYLETPTCVNNVETFCCVPAIIEHGPAWFAELGSDGSPGTKLLSISGDCAKPGIYEFEFGTSLRDVLNACGGQDAQAVQLGGPSGQMVGKTDFDRTVCYDDLATGGSVMVFNQSRDVVEIARQFMEFFCEESCGYCTPCRVGNVLLKERLDKIVAGKGSEQDLEYLGQLGNSIKTASRCGLGQTSPNPVLCSIKNFPDVYRKHFQAGDDKHAFLPTFDIKAAIAESEDIIGRQSVIFPEE